MWGKILWCITLPWFFGVYVFTNLLEALIWLVKYPATVWAQVKEWLGLSSN